jgi:hypothetical protein
MLALFCFMPRTILLSKIFTGFKEISTIDLRALAMMRILIAITLFIDIVIRIFNLKAHYSNEGILPLEALFRYTWKDYYYSLYTVCSSWKLLLPVFLINLACIFALLLGYHTKWSTFLCWFFLLSLHNRNPLIHQGGDDLLRMVLFWALFLPWGKYYSIDAIPVKNEPQRTVSYTSPAVLAYILQVMYVYVFSALLKHSPEWKSEYTALYYALSFDQIVLGPGKILYQYYDFLKFITAAVYHIELYVPLVLLIPFRADFFRLLFIIIFCGMHAGIASCLNVGIFPLIAIVSMTALLPSRVMDRLKKIQLFHNIYGTACPSKNFLQQNSFNSPLSSAIKNMVILFFTAYVFCWNLQGLGKRSPITTLKMEWIAFLLRIDQNWGMFAPSVFKDDGWFVFEGKNLKNKNINILEATEKISFAKSEKIQTHIRSDRWRKYAENFLMISNAHLRPYYCFFLMNQWNNDHVTSDKINELKIHYVKEISLPHYKTTKPVTETLCTCRQEINK